MMKKTLITILSLTVIVCSFVACDNEKQESEFITRPELSFNPRNIGEFHNFALKNVIVKTPSGKADSPEMGMEQMKSIYVRSLGEFNSYKGENIGLIEVNNDKLLELAHPSFMSTPVSTFKEYSNVLANRGVIDSRELDFFYDVLENVGNVEKLYLIQKEWDSLNYPILSGKGAVTEALISLAISSNEYWAVNNHNEGFVQLRLSPAHVDVGGFVVGAVLTGIKQGDDLGWEDTANIIAGGVMTGVMSSAGAAAKIGKWLYGIF